MTVPGPGGLGMADALVRLSHLVQHVFADVAREHGLTSQQLQLVCMLLSGPLGMTELSRLMRLERSSLTGLVDRVEKRGLVSRVADPADRRALRVALTEGGSGLADRAHDDVVARLDAMTGRLERDDRDRMAAAVALILTEHAPAPTTSGP
ncbi:MarR family winged helix-turn-helix transcriptional regulator [Bailinhaonella thermotolerans]|uniref:MarR family transcriptional regulator n=1 Tax=Bailinhaonella thermotolerans TaxID=1070861 RepID=A0A3A4A2R7_9ACTN|nr:MarR family transcriptional regulator [Bailinhaonella thermotolerans]RJL23036.1 MarR family transcriptional regulator [Bailinhaonella thermotolerans]